MAAVVAPLTQDQGGAISVGRNPILDGRQLLARQAPEAFARDAFERPKLSRHAICLKVRHGKQRRACIPGHLGDSAQGPEGRLRIRPKRRREDDAHVVPDCEGGGQPSRPRGLKINNGGWAEFVALPKKKDVKIVTRW